MMKRRMKRAAVFLLVAIVAAGCTALGIDYAVKQAGSRYILEAGAAPEADAILVLGARVYPDGGVSMMLRDRLQVALDLYNAGKAPRLLVSGDHGQPEYDEVNAMKRFLTERGVSAERIFLDHAGFSTYESMYRAKHIFQADKLIIVTQNYHLMRAVYNARQMGIEAYGVASDLNRYPGAERYELREIAARNKDFLFVHLLKPKPTYLGDVIPLTGNAAWTHDKP